jgi:hypothetical protein
MPTVTVTEIAERIRKGDESAAVVADRLRNWTKEGLLLPEGERNPGTGRRRHYPETAIIDALVLSVLTEQVGMPAVRTRHFKKLWEVARERYLLNLPRKQYLVIGLSPKNASIGQSTPEGISSQFRPEHDAHVVVDLHRLFERAQGISTSGPESISPRDAPKVKGLFNRLEARHKAVRKPSQRG